MLCVKMGHLRSKKKQVIFESGQIAVTLFITGDNKDIGFRKVKMGNYYCKFIEKKTCISENANVNLRSFFQVHNVGLL